MAAPLHPDCQTLLAMMAAAGRPRFETLDAQAARAQYAGARSAVQRLRNVTTPVVILEVSDSGPGIPADIQGRLFDPFFTTKENGTGLGLAIALRIVERHGGALEFQTQPGRGTVFGVVLPVSPSTDSRDPALAADHTDVQPR